jgi:putative ABC transport system permease protein
MAMTTRIEIDARRPGDDSSFVGYDIVTPGYLHVLGQSLIKGRDLAALDGPESAGVAVVNETMARQLWPNVDPVGKRLRPGFSRTDVPWAVDAAPQWLTVIGVASDIKEFRLNEAPRPVMYLSHRQFPSAFMYIMVRTSTAPAALAPSIQREINAVDPDQPISNVRTMEQAVSDAVPRFSVELLGLFAGVALLLSTIGVYGVTSHAVSQRTREIGIRMAIGASGAEMLAMVIKERVVDGLIGVTLGILGALALTRAMSTMLYGVTPRDAGAYTGASVALIAAALVASYLPARRAASVDPMTALRIE